MEEFKHWAASLEVGDKARAIIRHKTDGSKNIINATVIVTENNELENKILAAYQNKLYHIPYNELSEIHKTKTMDKPMTELRKIRYTFTSGTVGEGYFHCWGSEFNFERNAVITVAIVESSQGRVMTFKPHQIEFLEPPEEVEFNNI